MCFRNNVLAVIGVLYLIPLVHASDIHSTYFGLNSCEKAVVTLTDNYYGSFKEYRGVQKASEIDFFGSQAQYVVTLDWDKPEDECTLQTVMSAVQQPDGSCIAHFLFDQMDPENNTSYGVAGVDCG